MSPRTPYASRTPESENKPILTFLQIRSQADEIILRRAEGEPRGIRVRRDRLQVTEIQFQGGNPNSRAISTTWQNKKGQTGSISFDYVIDTSRRNGIISPNISKTVLEPYLQ